VSVSIQAGADPAVEYAGDGNTFFDEESGVTFWWLTADPNNPEVGTGYEITGWNALLKEDPFVTNNITLTNTTGSTQTFIVSVLLPITAFPYDATIASSVGVTATDSNGNGSVSVASVSPDGIYSGTVNGSTILTLLSHPTTISCASAGCSTTLSDNSAVPQLAAGPGAATSIGITLKFTLSAFDSVGITSRFEVINVPEPGTLGLLAAGLGALAISRRRSL
jgi:hypothetical protein